MENINEHMPLSNDWNKERLEQLKQLMPDLFTNDGELNINELKKVVDPKSVNETERYEFRWFGKSNAKREAFTPTDATLVYDDERSVHPNESENFIIEGENLAVLKLLSNSYREQVKCIYIDPPYNTGKDFVYSDKFNQDKKEYWEDAEITENGFKIDTNIETDGRFHSKWLNMMYSRLLIARQLLREDGVIFISIDDNEFHHLRELCDNVFGKENFISSFIWNSDGHTDNQYDVKVNHEYIISYSKNTEKLKLGYVIDPNTRKESNLWKGYAENSITKNGSGNPPSEVILPKGFPVKSKTLNLDSNEPESSFYSLITETGYITRQTTEKYKVSYPIRKDKMVAKNNSLMKECKVYSGWANVDKLKEFISNSFLPVKDDNGDETTFFLSENGVIYYHKKRDKARNILSVLRNFGTTEQMRSEIEKMALFFDYPKPKELLKYLIKIGTDKNDLILDFFAGAGSTGHAISELIQEDTCNRKYILVQLPEQTDEKSEAHKAGYKKISDITIERNKRVIEKIIKEKKEATPDLFKKEESEQEQLKGLGFKVFKLQKSNFPRVEFAPDPEKTEEENIELLKKYIKDKEAQLVNAFNRDELVTEILIKNGFKLNYKLTKQEEFKKNEILLATDGDKETLICLDVIITDETVEYFKTNIDQKLIVLERALDTTKKWNLKHAMGDKFNAF